MINSVNMDAEEMINNFGMFSVEDAQLILHNIPYDYYTAEHCYRVSSPKVTVRKGKAMCIDGALLGAALTGVEPDILFLGYNEKSAHAVLLVTDEPSGLFGAIGKSKRPELNGRPARYARIYDLAESYAKNNGERVIGFSVYRWNDYFPDWMDTEEDMRPYGARGWQPEHYIE